MGGARQTDRQTDRNRDRDTDRLRLREMRERETDSGIQTARQTETEIQR